MVQDHFCKGCVFNSTNHNICNYLLVMDVRRGCPAGEGCDKKMTKKEYFAMGMQKDWDKKAGKRMWEAGRGDADIAKAMGVTQGTISYFRRKHWEPERDAAAAAEAEKTPVQDCQDSTAITSNEEKNPSYEGQAAEEASPAETPIYTPDCIIVPNEELEPPVPIQKEAEQKTITEVSPSTEGPGIARAEEPDTSYQHLIRALEEATGNLTGMDAVMTAQIITALWGWNNKSDLLEAKACLDYLIKRYDHGCATQR